MILRRVQHVKVVFDQLDLRPLCDGKAHAEENFAHLVKHLRQRVKSAEGGLCARHGHVDRFTSDSALDLACGDVCARLVDGCFNGGAHLVCQLPDERTLFGTQHAHATQNGGQLSLFAKEAHARVFEHIGQLGALNDLKRLPLDFLQFLFQNEQLLYGLVWIT